MNYGDVPAVAIPPAAVCAAIEDLSKAPSLAHRPVSRFDPGPLQRFTTHVTNVTSFWCLLIFLLLAAAVMSPRGQKTIRTQMFDSFVKTLFS